ncbi:hypothetical protein RIF29_04999 [Crotalaria pallida]|uniref:Galactose oxidase n=1 Tax=Crotalaria pallida TaxID=3830 RepID=A0AAN9J2K8_CROPI
MNALFAVSTLLFYIILFTTLITPYLVIANNGTWQLLQLSIGISAMHMQLLNNDRVIMFDRTDARQSWLPLPHGGNCRHYIDDKIPITDCTAHSVEYDVVSNTTRGLFLQSDTWCSSGSVAPNGMLIQTGGFNDGDRKVRTFTPCSNSTCEWKEVNGGLNVRRWYATNHRLVDGRQIIIGGTKQFNYEFYPKSSSADSKTYNLPFLAQTCDIEENNLYPYVFLNVDGNLFIFANNRAILFNNIKDKVVRTYPMIPDGHPRNYPSTGSAVLLPLRNLESKNIEAEVVVCGGAPRGSFLQANIGQLLEALNTCARLKITDPKATWTMETMPRGRVMSDMVMLPNGNVLIINGANLGVAGWDRAANPILEPFLYKPNSPIGSRFEVQTPTTIPRMYHSATVLLRDGRILIGGSNPHHYYTNREAFYPTETSIEAFSPNYLNPNFASLRPKILKPSSQSNLKYGQNFSVSFHVNGALTQDSLHVTMLSPPFNTHSFSMDQRLLVLTNRKINVTGKSTYEFNVRAPGSPILAPPGYYILFVVHQEIPSEGIWIRISA